MKGNIVYLCALQVALGFIHLSFCQEIFFRTIEPGENKTLNCIVTENKKVTALRLTRKDLQPEYVLVYRDDRIDEKEQNPLFKDRTELQSTQSINGTVNLILKNLTEKDNGTYICRVKCETDGTRRKRAISQTIFHLSVRPRDNQPAMTEDAGKNGEVNNELISRTYAPTLIAAILVAMLLVSVFIAVRKKSHLARSPEDETFPKMLVPCPSEREKISC